MTMNKRGGPPVKLFIVAAVFMGCIYFIYVYHGKLRDAEASAERYRRSDEAKVGQLQDSMKEKEVLQQKCETDRQEFLNRLSSLNSQHKMLKGQHDELEAENGRLQQESQKLRDDNANVEAQRSQEFNQMKQEKELEIASLKDQLANMKRQNDELQNEISSLKSQLENAQKQLIVDQGSIRDVEKHSHTQQKQHVLDQSTIHSLEQELLALKALVQSGTLAQKTPIHGAPAQKGLYQGSLSHRPRAHKQQASAAVQAMHDFQQQQQQNQGFQQQNVVQQNKQAPANVQDLVYQNQNLGQGQGQLAGQGQGQLAGQGQAQLPAQGLSMDGIQNMNQNIAAQNIGQNQNGQIPPAGLENQAAALAAAQLQLQKQQQQQGQGDFNNVGQADGQRGVDNAQHQMEAPHMGGEVPIRGAVNQREFEDIEVRRGDMGAEPDVYGNLNQDREQEDGNKQPEIEPLEIVDNPDILAVNDENVRDFDVDKIVPPVHVEDSVEADKYDDVAVGDNVPDDKEKIENAGHVDVEDKGKEDNYDDVADMDGNGELEEDDNKGGEVELDNAQGGVLAQPRDQQGDQDIAHPDIVENEGQIFKPDFNLNKFDDNDDKGNNEDNYHNADHPPEEDGDHDNRMQNEGPVNLQVQEPPNGNVDRAQHEAGGLNLNKDIQPLQAQGQAQEQGQILMPDIGLAKHKDGEVRVEGEGRKEAPLPHERDM